MIEKVQITDVQQTHFIDKGVDIPVAMPRQTPVAQRVQKTVATPQIQFIDRSGCSRDGTKTVPPRSREFRRWWWCPIHRQGKWRPSHLAATGFRESHGQERPTDRPANWCPTRPARVHTLTTRRRYGSEPQACSTEEEVHLRERHDGG